jgi:hypothetical protein
LSRLTKVQALCRKSALWLKIKQAAQTSGFEPPCSLV